MKTIESSALDDIKSNRHRVRSIFTRLEDARDKEDVLLILTAEELLYEQLLS